MTHSELINTLKHLDFNMERCEDYDRYMYLLNQYNYYIHKLDFLMMRNKLRLSKERKLSCTKHFTENLATYRELVNASLMRLNLSNLLQTQTRRNTDHIKDLNSYQINGYFLGQ